MTPFKNKTIHQILLKYRDLWALSYTSAISHWDLETYMPPMGAGARGEALGRLSVIRQRIFLDREFVSLIHKAGKLRGLTDAEKAIVRVIEHALKFYEKIPSGFLEEFEVLTNKATVVWREAKQKDNFKLFEPHLAKIFEMNRRAAEYLGYKNSAYDALLDQFEEGLTVSKVEPFFEQIRDPLKDLLKKIVSSEKYQKSHPLEFVKYDEAKMRELNIKVLKYFWPEFSENFRLDVSAHPFTTSFNKFDTRITTWYHKKDFARSLLATVHEFGHALYDMHCADELEKTPIEGGSSLVIHESQSRFWENFIGRSTHFIKKFKPEMEKVVGRKLKTEDIYTYFSQVKPSLLRVEADEVTYHFHIMLRYEIEKGIIEGKLKTQDLREIWEAKMKEYLGVSPQSDSDGVLQDIHWSSGMVGYFPTYSLGTFLGAQWESKLGELTDIFEIEKWLKNHIHKFGSTYTLEDLLEKNKMKLDPEVNLKYLKEKYSKIYNF